MLTMSQCREILGKTDLSDQKIEEIRDMFVVLSDLAIDSFLEKRNRVNGDCYEKSKIAEIL